MTQDARRSVIGAAWLAAATLLAGGSAYADACNPDMLARLPPASAPW